MLGPCYLRSCETFKHGIGHVNADHLAGGANHLGGDETIKTAARAHVQHSLTGRYLPNREGIAHTGERLDRFIGEVFQELVLVFQNLGQRPAVVKVGFKLRAASNFGIFLLDVPAQYFYIRRNLNSLFFPLKETL